MEDSFCYILLFQRSSHAFELSLKTCYQIPRDQTIYNLFLIRKIYWGLKSRFKHKFKKKQ